MIRVTYLKGKNLTDSKAYATNPFLQILFLSILFVISAQNHPILEARSVIPIIGLAALLAFPADAYYISKGIRKRYFAHSTFSKKGGFKWAVL